jgi:MFS family permease
MDEIKPKIEIFKPFGEAFELMKRILFQPFDLGKWCVIGFAAFLANLGGGGFNYRFNNLNSWKTSEQQPELHNLLAKFQQIPGWILILGITLLVLVILTIAIVFAWLRARGRFMFIDCVVKNRGAIKEPWREFRKEGDSFFLFSVLLNFGFFAFAALLSLPFMLPMVRGVTFLHLHDVYLISMIALWAVVVFLLFLAWILIAHFMITVMYCRRCRAQEAFRIALSLISNYPGEITLYCLFWIVLAVGAGLIACAATCLTCCIAIIPYVGTVILLPIFVCLRGFGLLFLRQFGPGYDVWAGLSIATASTPPATPPDLPPIQT